MKGIIYKATNKLKIIRKDINAEILVATPLLTGHKISKETEQSIKRNTVPIIWASYEGPNKHAANVQHLLNAYKKQFGKFPPYIQILDRDIIAGRYMLDRLWEALNRASIRSDKKIGYAYANFEYKGYINIKFPARPFDINSLVKGNYISSNSLYCSEVIEDVGGFVTEEKYHRLSDYAFFLKLFYNGYQGISVPNASFVAISSKDDISAGSQEEYIETFKRVQEDFVKPIKERWVKNTQ